jgi:hypothetical protein
MGYTSTRSIQISRTQSLLWSAIYACRAARSACFPRMIPSWHCRNPRRFPWTRGGRIPTGASRRPSQCTGSRHPLTEQGAAGPIPDLVNRDFTAGKPGQKMVGDITYSAWEGWVHLVTVIDCATRKIVGRATLDPVDPAGKVRARNRGLRWPSLEGADPCGVAHVQASEIGNGQARCGRPLRGSRVAGL